MTHRRRPFLALLLAFLVVLTGMASVGRHHDHADTAHHADCPTCRLADEAAGALPVLEADAGVILPAAATPMTAPDVVPAPVRVHAANPLRAPPTA